MKKIILILITLLLFAACNQESNNAVLDDEETFESFPYELNEEEINDFKLKMKGTWIWFGVPKENKPFNLYRLFINDRIAQADGTYSNNFLCDVSFDGQWNSDFRYWIDSITRLDKNRYLLNVTNIYMEHAIHDDYTESIEIFDIDDVNKQLKAIFHSNKETDNQTFEFLNKEFLYQKVDDNFNSTLSFYNEWLEENNLLNNIGNDIVCIVVSGIRQRKSPNGEIYKDFSGKDDHIQRGCYLIQDKQIIDEYTWYKIGEERWVGTLPDWIILRQENDNLDSFDYEYEKYLVNQRQSTVFGNTDYKKLGEWLKMSEEEIEIVRFLHLVLPIDSHFNSYIPFDWDSNKPSVESKYNMYRHIFLSSILNADGYSFSTNNESRDNYINDLKAKNLSDSYSYIMSFVEEDIINSYTRKFYGNPIDFRTVENSYNGYKYHVYYDALTHSYGNSDPTGVGTTVSMIYIIDLTKEDEYINIDAAVFDLESTSNFHHYTIQTPNEEDYPYGFAVTSNESPYIIKDEDRFDYLENKAKKIKIVLTHNKIENNYQLVSVKTQ